MIHKNTEGNFHLCVSEVSQMCQLDIVLDESDMHSDNSECMKIREQFQTKNKHTYTVRHTQVVLRPARAGSQQNNMRPIRGPLVWLSPC